MEIEVAAEDLISTLTGENNLDAHFPNLLGEEVHRSGGSDRGNIIGLQVPDEVLQVGNSLLKFNDCS